MDNPAKILRSESDEVLVVDGTMVGQGVKELAVMLKKQHNSPPVLLLTDQNGNATYLFSENPDERDVTTFTMLMVTKLFDTAKGKGVMELWQAAVDKMNAQVNKWTCRNPFDPPSLPELSVGISTMP
jgi:hypothetical protein